MKVPKSIFNWLSITGIFLAVNSIILIIVLFIISFTLDAGHTYVGLYLYIALPMIMVLGLVLIPIGMIFKMKQLKSAKISELNWPKLDLNDPAHRRKLAIASAGTLIFLLVSAAGSYKAFHYTESIEFCGTLCHSVMEPEYVAYQNSPHARVKCVECHVGEGADWYVKSKLSGLYQVYSVLFNKFPRPIPTPIQSLRPARETCEKCHWPQKFYAQKLHNQRGFLTDSVNTEWDITMMMKIGPKFSAFKLSEGIHWHINPDVKIEYISNTNDRESIPWVKYTNLKTGEVRLYKDTSKVISQKTLDSLQTRIVDCMDCHNRPSHNYKSAPVYVDNAILSGIVPQELGYIKSVAMNVLKTNFRNKDTALMTIRDNITATYKDKYPAIYAGKKDLIDKAIAGIQQEYQKNNFPFMNVTYNSYLSHIGHMESDGCFRCHDNKHKTDKGKVIKKDCNLCHTIIAQGTPGKLKSVSIKDTLQFEHPVDVGDAWKETNCAECHRVLY